MEFIGTGSRSVCPNQATTERDGELVCSECAAEIDSATDASAAMAEHLGFSEQYGWD